MGRICTTITTAITSTVTEPVSSWVSQQKKECSKRKWPLNWLCWFITVLVEVINWIIRNVIVYTTSIVCNFITWVIGKLFDALIGSWCYKCHLWITDWFFECPKIEGISIQPSNNNPDEFDFKYKCNCNCYKSKEITVTAKNEGEANEIAKVDCAKACQ